MSMKQKDRETVENNLRAAFGVKTIQKQTITSRSKSLNIAAFNETHYGLGTAFKRMTFNEAAEILQRDGIDGTDKDYDRLLARKSGVRLSNGVVLKDLWTRGQSTPTKYED